MELAIDTYGGGNYQGDIMLTEKQRLMIAGKTRRIKRQKRGGKTREKRNLKFTGYWPRSGSVVNVPYVTEDWDNFSNFEKANIARAIEEYSNKTCIR